MGGRSAKRKGSAYEREFVQKCIELGHKAKRVPLSGAMKEYKDDVVVGENDSQFRVECKYRADGSNFKRLHGWMPDPGAALILPESGLMVLHLVDWLNSLDDPPAMRFETKKVTKQSGLLDWLGEADALAVRKPRAPWLVCVRAGEQPDE